MTERLPIAEIYRVEREAKNAGIVGTDEHLALRKHKPRPVFAKVLQWARRHRRSYGRKSGLARAIRYLLNSATGRATATTRDAHAARR